MPQIRDFVVARYGEFVLLKPRLTARTAILWATPFLIILVGFAVILRRRKGFGRSRRIGPECGRAKSPPRYRQLIKHYKFFMPPKA